MNWYIDSIRTENKYSNLHVNWQADSLRFIMKVDKSDTYFAWAALCAFEIVILALQYYNSWLSSGMSSISKYLGTFLNTTCYKIKVRSTIVTYNLENYMLLLDL